MPDEQTPAALRNVLHPVADVAAATNFYQQALGLGVKFVDGDRYAGLDAGGTTLALAGPAEDITSGIAAPSFKVSDVDAALTQITAAGGNVVRAPETGPHEIRAVAHDPWGNTIIVYSGR